MDARTWSLRSGRSGGFAGPSADAAYPAHPPLAEHRPALQGSDVNREPP